MHRQGYLNRMVLDASVVVAGQKSYASLHDVDQEDVDLGMTEMMSNDEESGARYRRRSPGPLFLSSLVVSSSNASLYSYCTTPHLYIHTLFTSMFFFFSI